MDLLDLLEDWSQQWLHKYLPAPEDIRRALRSQHGMDMSPAHHSSTDFQATYAKLAPAFCIQQIPLSW